MKIDLVNRYEIKILTICMILLAAAAGWLLLTRPAYRIEGDFLQREDRRHADAWLAEQMQSPIAEHRARACLALGRIGNPETLDLLISAAKDPIARVRAAAAFAIGEMEDEATLAELGLEPEERAAEALLGMLHDDERKVVANTVEALGKLGWRTALEPITRTPAPLPVTLAALLRMRGVELAPWIGDWMKSDDQDIRWAAAVALAELGVPVDSETTRSLINLTRDTNPFVRAAVARGLAGAEPTAEIVDSLAKLASDRDPKVRIEAVRSIGAVHAKGSLEMLAAALSDANENVRITAVEAMATLGDHRASSLLQSLRFRDSPVAWAAEQTLAALTTSDAHFFTGFRGVPPIYKNPAGMEAFVQALGKLPSERATELLAELWESGEEHVSPVRSLVLHTLAAQGIADLRSYLAAAVEDTDWTVRRTALELMPSPRVETCLAAYRRAIAQPATAVRIAALDAASRALRSPEQRKFFLEALADPDRLVRIRAAKHLRMLHDEDHGQQIGLADTRYAREDYQRIARTLNRRLKIDTSDGMLDVLLDYEHAPLTAENFFELARRGYFNGQRFVTVVPNQFVKAGDPRGDGQGGPGYTIRCEVNTRPFLRGSLGMAVGEKDSGGSQFFICLSPQLLFDGRYTNFGRLISGDDVIDRITTETRILGIEMSE